MSTPSPSEPSTATVEKPDYNDLDRRVRAHLDIINERFPRLGLTFGYIGNLERWGDDREWRVFTKFVPPEGGQRVTWGGYESKDPAQMRKLLADVESGELVRGLVWRGALTPAEALFDLGVEGARTPASRRQGHLPVMVAAVIIRQDRALQFIEAEVRDVVIEHRHRPGGAADVDTRHTLPRFFAGPATGMSLGRMIPDKATLRKRWTHEWEEKGCRDYAALWLEAGLSPLQAGLALQAGRWNPAGALAETDPARAAAAVAERARFVRETAAGAARAEPAATTGNAEEEEEPEEEIGPSLSA